jgi:hypothetical protein
MATPTTTTPKPRWEPRSDYELDDVASRVLIPTLEAAIERDERRHRTKIVGLIKERSWQMAARQVPPGHG